MRTQNNTPLGSAKMVGVDLDEPESLEKKEDSIKQEVKSDTIKKADDSSVKETLASAPQKSFRIIPAWIRRISSQDTDWKTEQLEAEQYKHLDPRIRREVDQAVTYVKHGTTTNRDWIALEIVVPSPEKGKLLVNHLDISIMLSFRIGDEVEPRLAEEFLQDSVENSTVATHVREGHYDVSHQDGTIIARDMWKSVVRRDMSLEMKIWHLDLPH
ncbi:hypothetical protein QQZ08_001801 [Neonectria magnoliae]|uniref:Ubiquitin-like domain-containing protein n=1 Tax=Neonectria magnoliae TaxID=2732573 RepID=A0ABR1IFE8_9HYPO